jgi:hypothetical protein
MAGIALPYQPQSAILQTATVAATSTPIVKAGACLQTLTIFSAPGAGADVWLNPSGGDAVVGQGARLPAAGSLTFKPPPIDAVSAIAATGSVTISAIGA